MRREKIENERYEEKSQNEISTFEKKTQAQNDFFQNFVIDFKFDKQIDILSEPQLSHPDPTDVFCFQAAFKQTNVRFYLI